MSNSYHILHPKPLIHVAAAFDQNYILPFYSLLNSLFAHHSPGELHIHLIAAGLSAGEKRNLALTAERAGHRMCFYEVDVSKVENFGPRGKWTSSVYYRLFFPELVDESVERVLYLDTDTVVVKSLRSLYEQDLEHFPVAAVYDNYVKTQPLIGITEEHNYFNSGVLLIDVIKWRSQQITARTFQYLRDFPERILFVDQCALNAVLKGNWKMLPPCYNMMYSILPEGISKKSMSKYVQEAVIVHFTLQRPWHMLCRNRLRYLYFHYLKQRRVPSSKRYTDFEIGKIPAWLNIRLLEFYFDSPTIQKIWRIMQVK